MTKNDIPFLSQMVNIAGWNQLDNDWKRYIDLGPNSCFVAELNGIPVGTATTISYENKIGWIGMVIVSPQFRGQHIGTTLLKRCIDYLAPIVKIIKLDATPLGGPVYKKLGFKKELKIIRMETTAKLFSQSDLPIITTTKLGKIINYDKKSFGASREKILSRLFKEYPQYSALMEVDEKVLGYVLANPGKNQWHIGPLVAHSTEIFELLLSVILTKLLEQKVYIDVPIIADNRLKILKNFGFNEYRSYTRMYLGDTGTNINYAKIFATARAEKG